MYYKLAPEYALRRWKNIDTVLYHLTHGQPTGLDIISFLLLKQCDGITPCDPENEMLKRFAEKKIILPCEYGDAIEENQKYRAYANEYFPIVQWSITNRCNYPCKHCFMTSSAKNETAEPTHEQCMDIIDQFAECGIHDIYLTGGEPLLRKDFLQIIDKLTEKNINISIISTNGLLVNEALITEIKNRGVQPAFAISYDGIGTHDWMRGFPGAEEASLNAIKLLVKHGFPVIVETAVHKGNADVIPATAELARSLRVHTFKTIRVAESPRWKELNEGNNLSPKAYYDICLELTKMYKDKKWDINSKLIGFGYWHHKTGFFEILPMKGLPTDTDNTVLCKKARSILYISGDGRLLTCNPFSGLSAGEDWGNIYTSRLSELLTQSEYLTKVNARVKHLKVHDKKCRECKWFKYCLGGCRACAYGIDRDYLSADTTKCDFFEGGYVEKIRAVMGAENCTPDF